MGAANGGTPHWLPGRSSPLAKAPAAVAGFVIHGLALTLVGKQREHGQYGKRDPDLPPQGCAVLSPFETL